MIRRFAVCCSCLLLAVLAAIPLLAQAPPQFSADMKFTSPRGMSGAGTMYFGGDKVRMEMSTSGHESIMITDMTHKVAYMLMPQQHMYMEMSTDKPGAHRGPDWRMYNAANPCATMPETTCQKAGMDMVNGRLCNKWLFTGKSAGSNRTVWIDQKTGIPIKTQTSDGALFELTNIKEGAQSRSLFEIPAGYQKMDMGNMMQRFQRPQ